MHANLHQLTTFMATLVLSINVTQPLDAFSAILCPSCNVPDVNHPLSALSAATVLRNVVSVIWIFLSCSYTTC